MVDAWDPWSYRESARRADVSVGIVGYKVHAKDGDIGKVDEASDEVGAASIVVDTGPWIFGRRVVLPAGTVERVDDAEEEIYVDLTKDQIKDSPELGEGTSYSDPAYRSSLDDYYGTYYR